MQGLGFRDCCRACEWFLKSFVCTVVSALFFFDFGSRCYGIAIAGICGMYRVMVSQVLGASFGLF